MSEQTAPVEGVEETNGQTAEFQAITSQEDFDKAIQSRIARERAKFADYEQVKADAAELASIRDAQKTAEQKQAEELATAQAQIAELTAARARAEVAAAKGVPPELLTGSNQEELEASAEALIKFKADSNRAGYQAANEGRGSGANGTSTADSFARFFEDAIN